MRPSWRASMACPPWWEPAMPRGASAMDSACAWMAIAAWSRCWTEMDPIRWLRDVSLADRPSGGGQGAPPGELTRAGIAVPSGFVVSTDAFDRVIQTVEKRTAVRARVETLDADDLESIQKCSADIQGAMLSHALPEAVRVPLREA